MPKKFSFSLNSILKYRESMENKRAITLNNKKIILQSEETKLQNIKELKEKTLVSSKNSDHGRLSILDRKINDEYIAQINQDILNQNHVVTRSKQNVEHARHILNEETKKKKILEKLKDKQFEDFRVDTRRREEKEGSEVALRKNYFSSN